MENSGGILALAATAAAFGAVHTAANPAHYLPFVAIGKSHGWGLPKILAFAVACGMGHLLSSVAVGGLGNRIWRGCRGGFFSRRRARGHNEMGVPCVCGSVLFLRIARFDIGAGENALLRVRCGCKKNRRVVGQGELLDVVFDFYARPVRNTRASRDGSGF